VPHSYDESLWETDPWYVPGRDPVSHMLEGRKGEKVREAEQLTHDLKRNIDVEYNHRAFRFMEENTQALWRDMVLTGRVNGVRS
jgi:hypothetical protein